MNLSLELQNNLVSQIYNKAQDIDVAILSYASGEKEFFLDAMSLYQNTDGGFGHNLYIDNYNPNSSAVTSFYALILLDIFRIDSKEASLMLNKVFTYLYHKADVKDELFLSVPKDNDKYAHNSILDYKEEGSLPLTIGVLGLTFLLLDETKPYFKLALEKYNKIKNKISTFKFDSDNVITLAILISGLKKANITFEYTIDSTLVDVRNIILINEFISYDKDLLARALNTLIASINKNGLWDHNINWGNNYPEVATAAIKWSFRTSVMNFYYLNKYKLVDSN